MNCRVKFSTMKEASDIGTSRMSAQIGCMTVPFPAGCAAIFCLSLSIIAWELSTENTEMPFFSLMPSRTENVAPPSEQPRSYIFVPDFAYFSAKIDIPLRIYEYLGTDTLSMSLQTRATLSSYLKSATVSSFRLKI